MKRMLSVLMVLLLLTSAAWAQTDASGNSADVRERMPRAAVLPDWNALKRYASFEQDGTVWSVRSNQGEAALAQLGWGHVPYDGYVCFGLELTGDSETGVTVPVMTFYYDGDIPLNGRAASIAANGVRYDFLLCREEVQVGKVTAEKLTAPLDEAGLDMIRAMLSADEVYVWLQGDMTYEMKIDPSDRSFASIREELAVRSMGALSDMLREFEAMAPYTLWDINEAWWVRMKGVRPQMRVTELSGERSVKVEGVTLRAPMFMLSRGMINDEVRVMQRLLIAGGFMQGSADGAYGEGTVRAVEAAQTWFSLMPTGSADETLIALLSGGTMPEAEYDGGEEAAMRTADGLCEMTISRFWFADAVESTGGDRRSVLDRDDTLIIYEGVVKNLSKSNLDFYWQISAVVRCGEYEYPCVLVCERNEGMSLSSTLPPRGEARLLVYAEIPENIVSEDEWSLEISAGEYTFLFE